MAVAVLLCFGVLCYWCFFMLWVKVFARHACLLVLRYWLVWVFCLCVVFGVHCVVGLIVAFCVTDTAACLGVRMVLSG